MLKIYDDLTVQPTLVGFIEDESGRQTGKNVNVDKVDEEKEGVL